MAEEEGADPLLELINKCVQEAFESPKNIATLEELEQQGQLAASNFSLADKDKSGTISFDELPGLCDFMGLPLQEDEEEMLLSMDKDGSGVLELEEWLMWWLSRVSCLPNPLAQQEVLARNVFAKFDADGSGSIDASEINDLFLSLGANFSKDEIKEALIVLDTDNSGIVDVEEFVGWWMNRVSDKRKSGGMIALKLKRLAAKASQIYNTDIFTAIWNNDIDLVKAFVQADKRIVNSSDVSEFGGGWMPLHYAAYQGHEEMVKVLLDNGAKVAGTNNDNFTPLFYAVQQGHVQICALLLDKGSDPTAAGKFIQMNNDNSITTKVVVSKCPIDVCIIYPEIVDLLTAHPKCKGPEPLASSQFAAALSRKGLLTIDLPPQRLYTSAPVREWVVQLLPESKDHSSESKASEKAIMEFNIASKPPNEDQQIIAAIEKGWMRRIMQFGQNIEMTLRLAPIDAFKRVHEYSSWIVVDYTPPTNASETKAVEEALESNNDIDTAAVANAEDIGGEIDAGVQDAKDEHEADYSHHFELDDAQLVELDQDQNGNFDDTLELKVI